MKICIDPGHSGPVEPGCCSGGATEAATVLQISKIIATMLEGAGHEVLLTRIDDVNDDLLMWRVNKASAFGADIFVSIHCNGFKDPAAHGTEVWYYPGSKIGELLADCIQQALIANCQTADRGIKTNDEWTVLKHTDCPAVLVELAFISNDKEREMLTDNLLQRQFAVGVCNGIMKFAQGGPLFGGAV